MKLKGTFVEPIVWWILMGGATTGAFLFTYVATQQNYRQSLNDPQIQIAEDAVQALQGGAAILDLVPNDKVDINASLKPFLIIYDTEGNPIAGNGYLGGQVMQTPFGVFQNAKNWGENRRTLEPLGDVRIASVVIPFTGREANGYVLAGRNMREVENRIGVLSLHMILLWGATMFSLLVGSFAGWFLLKR